MYKRIFGYSHFVPDITTSTKMAYHAGEVRTADDCLLHIHILSQGFPLEQALDVRLPFWTPRSLGSIADDAISQ